MTITPYNWNVIVKGSWNRAIFTPKRVAEKLYSVPSDTPMQVMVPLDGMAPQRISYNQVYVCIGDNFLEVGVEAYDFKKLEEAIKITVNAINWLKETPVFAGGYNIRYKIGTQEAVGITENLMSSTFTKITDAGFDIIKQNHNWVIPYKTGEIQIHVDLEQNGDLSLVFNFNKTSNIVGEIVSWFTLKEGDIKTAVTGILKKVFNIELE